MSDDHDEGKPLHARLGDSTPRRDESDEEPAPRLCVTLMLRGAYKPEVVAKALRQASQESRDCET
jgi:hypothetical protein